MVAMGIQGSIDSLGYIYMHVCRYVHVWACNCVGMDVYGCTCVYIYMDMYVYVYIYIHVCVCI